MRRRMLGTFTVAIAVGLVATACERTNPVGPAGSLASPTAASLDKSADKSQGKPQTVKPLMRTNPLTGNTSVSTIVDASGGTISIPSAGFTLVIPAGAVPVGTQITVVARNGGKVAYEFYPHGLHFAIPLIATQDVRTARASTGSQVNPFAVSVGYFPDSSSVESVTEMLNVDVSWSGHTVTTNIWHFSGYIYAGGRSDDGDGM